MTRRPNVGLAMRLRNRLPRRGPRVVHEYYGYTKPRASTRRRRKTWGRWAAELVLLGFLLIVLVAAITRPEVRHMVWWGVAG